ncbi:MULTISPECIES: PTS sugar transporter subunit IIA [Neisseria]|uniref:PTS mannose transporter subunit IIA n=1 Tax=Neisseria dumasiana TaxID=1931275 RepID=A0ABX3WNE8_9NEIS|nr:MULTISPECIES: PTS mannose transporter subunit IIA [Neisseria]KPN73917.1 PTS mannose transporter subunit IIA [Neisseria sp. 74A18]OSI17135.1 PTS mannose transporter subunit IIA [Neisseria dumasiana]OSI36330.1 PTS mannose transporter subunit IIA [Neisseria dumasiana]UOO84168.1 PTS mannose transporter subunit IIA [Neisseria dumasiana]
MIGLLIITHEAIGEAYQSLARHFFFGQTPENIRILGVHTDEDHESIINRAQQMVADLHCVEGVLIMTDIFGATPCNAARQLVESGKTAMLTGLNAPMMIKAANYSPTATDLAAFARSVKEAAISGIIDITEPPEGLPVC